jgi:hypothetical protein
MYYNGKPWTIDIYCQNANNVFCYY